LVMVSQELSKAKTNRTVTPKISTKRMFKLKAEALARLRITTHTPLTHEQAIAELRKFAGIQFDPKVVDAFVQTHWAEGVADPGRTIQPRPIPLIAQHASQDAAMPTSQTAGPTASPAESR